MSQILAESTSRSYAVRRAEEEDHEALVAFARSFERAGLPPVSAGWSLAPPAFVLLATYRGTIMGALRVELDERARVTHLVVSPSVEGWGIAEVLLEGGMTLARATGAVTLGGFAAWGTPLIPIVKKLGGQIGAVFLWVEGRLEPAADRPEPGPASSSTSIRPGPGNGHQETSR